jgi:hypothetical protein
LGEKIFLTQKKKWTIVSSREMQKSSKEIALLKCPCCKIEISNCKELNYKFIYKCGSCEKSFFIERMPKYFYASK